MRARRWLPVAVVPLALAVMAPHAAGQVAPGPSVVDPDLTVRTVADTLQQPTSAAFIGRDDALVLEKATGRVKRLPLSAAATGTATTVLDLPVNSFSERGLLGIAVHPKFPRAPYVYLYWTESTSGQDSVAPADVPLLGNRVDRFRWADGKLTLDRPIVKLRSRQNDATNIVAPPPATATATTTATATPIATATPTATPTATVPPTSAPTPAVLERGNHNGGKMVFGLDGKLYIEMGDQGRRGQMQNLADGPGCVALPCPAIPAGNLPDDQYGGPEPDDAHMTGVVLRLNEDGSTPRDNPFVKAGRERGGEVGRNYAKIYSFGVRNAFGLAVDPFSGALWDAQNGDDSFSEINRIPAGSNLGWVQAMGPLSRTGQYKAIETDRTTRDAGTNQLGYYGLQQTRFDPSLIAGSPREALERMYQVRTGVTAFKAQLSGTDEVPANSSGATGAASFKLLADGSLEYQVDVAQISDVRAAHVHLGGYGQNGPIVVELFSDAQGVSAYERTRLVHGRIKPSDIVTRAPGFDGKPAELFRRMVQGRAYVNVHTQRLPGGEIRGQIKAADGKLLSRYQDPELSWTYEVAPVGLGFLGSNALGNGYRGDMFVGAARNLIEGGQLFRMPLTRDRKGLALADKRLRDRVADNTFKYGIAESESLLFGRNFGVATDIQTGPNGNLFVLSISQGALYEIRKR